jgi:hypothetical protein
VTISRRAASPIIGALASAGLFLIALQTTGGVTTGDSGQFSAQVAAVSSGRLSRAFPMGDGSATPPGFALLAGVLSHVGIPAAAVGIACALVLAVSAAALARSLDPGGGGGPTVLAFAGVLALPAVWGALADLFHPQDLLAMALVCLALRGAVTNRWVAVGVWLGAAFVTKQWVVLAAIPVVAVAPSWRARGNAVVAAAGAAGALLAPFLFGDLSGTFRVLRAATVTRSEISLIAHAPFAPRTIDLAARLGPVAIAVGLVGAVVVVRRTGRSAGGGMNGHELVALTLACLSTRLLFDPALYLYYLVPVSTLILVLELPKRRLPVATASWCVLTFDLLAVPGRSSTAATLDAAVLFAVVMTALAFALREALGTNDRRQAPNWGGTMTDHPACSTVDSHSPEYLVTQG